MYSHFNMKFIWKNEFFSNANIFFLHLNISIKDIKSTWHGEKESKKDIIGNIRLLFFFVLPFLLFFCCNIWENSWGGSNVSKSIVLSICCRLGVMTSSGRRMSRNTIFLNTGPWLLASRWILKADIASCKKRNLLIGESKQNNNCSPTAAHAEPISQQNHTLTYAPKQTHSLFPPPAFLRHWTQYTQVLGGTFETQGIKYVGA